MSDQGGEDHVAVAPWFADREVPVLVYRINRRPRPQGKLFAVQPDNFMDHLVECLRVGDETVTKGHGHERHWMIGNRHISSNLDSFSGRIGFRSPDVEVSESYDSASGDWLTNVVETERTVTAPFAVAAGTRFLAVAKHKSFSESVLPKVFEQVLRAGEEAREYPTTDWAVEPVLDEHDFERWLRGTAVLQSIRFEVKLPNPDAEESFLQLHKHLDSAGAGEMTHSLKPRDPEAGLNKDFEQEPISQGLMAMARKSFAQLRAKGTGKTGSTREYSQTRRVRRVRLDLSGNHVTAQAIITEFAVNAPPEPEAPDGN